MAPTRARTLALLRAHGSTALVAAAALAIAWAFAVTVLRHTHPMGLPLDDSYIYLTYAKQAGRGAPFTYYPGGGYSAGSTSVLWPLVLAPFWALGARGHALVWVSFGVCALLHAATCAGVHRLVRRLAGEAPAAAAAVLVLGIGPLAWTALSGMEVAFASALLVAVIALLLDQPATGRPRRWLIAALAAASLSRPEATLLVIAVVGVAVLARLRQRDLASAAWWLAPLAAPAAWLLANKLLAGQLFPNTGVAKSHFYLPGFDLTYWLDAVLRLTGEAARGLCWAATSPLVWPRVVTLLWLVGVVRVAWWARRERRYLAGAVIAGAPLLLIGAVIASSGLWSFQSYRYIAPAFPLIAIPVGVALGAAGLPPWARRAAAAVALAGAALFARAALPGLAASARNFAQGAMDTNTQVVTIGRYLAAKQPAARVMFHDAGAIAYYGDTEVFDMLGLVTNFQAGVANHGPGARFEFLEALPEAARPTHFAYYPSWLGTPAFFGDVLLTTPLRRGFAPNRVVGDQDMQVITARWDHAGTGERPLTEHAGWAIVDRLDVAHLPGERAHGWRGALGRRRLGDPTARWSLVHREAGARGLVLDGGRTIRGGQERFTFAADPARPVRLVLRTGGPRALAHHETIAAPVPLELRGPGGEVLARATLPAPDGAFAEVVLELPAGAPRAVTTHAAGPYRAFHWFVLQPE